MAQRKSDCRFGQACPASLSMAKSAEAEKAGATQHSPKQRSQSARRLERRPSGEGAAGWSSSGNVGWSPVGLKERRARADLRAERAHLLKVVGIVGAAGEVVWQERAGSRETLAVLADRAGQPLPGGTYAADRPGRDPTVLPPPARRAATQQRPPARPADRHPRPRRLGRRPHPPPSPDGPARLAVDVPPPSCSAGRTRPCDPRRCRSRSPSASISAPTGAAAYAPRSTPGRARPCDLLGAQHAQHRRPLHRNHVTQGAPEIA